MNDSRPPVFSRRERLPLFRDQRAMQAQPPAPPPHREGIDNRTVGLLTIAIFAIAVVFGFLLLRCSANPEPVCHGVTRSQLSAEYLAKVAALKASGKCSSYSDANDCPDYQALKTEQDKRSEDWVRCQ